jgi:hypothetical protein
MCGMPSASKHSPAGPLLEGYPRKSGATFGVRELENPNCE